MNNSNTFGIAFYLKKQNAKNEQAPIYARITYQRRSVVISTKKSIPISHWNELKGVIKGRSDEARMVQKYLERFKSKIIQIFEELLDNPEQTVPPNPVKGCQYNTTLN